MSTPSVTNEQLTKTQLEERSCHRRAVEAVIWGMPAVNYDLLYQSTLRAGCGPNQVIYWSRLSSWKNQTLTPNPDVIYVFPFLNTKNGAVVLEIPPADTGSITGSLDDAWQTVVEDMGPAGLDKGKGGRYLILPPGYQGKIPEGYFALAAGTWSTYGILRSNLRSGSDSDVAAAVAYGKRVRVYPLSEASDPPETKFVDAVDVVYDNIIPYDIRFFESLHRFVQEEPWLERDKAMIDSLRTIGIEKGKPFSPDSNTKKILGEAVNEARAWLDLKYEAVFSSPYAEGAHWVLPASPEVVKEMQSNFADPDSYPLDGRGVTYSFAYFSAKHLGAGQFYLMTICDKAGKALDGASTYRLSVPANAPVKLYWSATVYNRANHALIRDVAPASRSSHSPGLQKNGDGSVDVYFGPKAPAGRETNWIPTSPEGRFEVLFRLYGPEKPFFDKVWRLPDIEKV